MSRMKNAPCVAADPMDMPPCEGPTDAVVVTEISSLGVLGHVGQGEGLTACVHHGARILASMVDGRVDPGTGNTTGRTGWPTACIEVFVREALPGAVWLRSDDPASAARRQFFAAQN